MTTQPLTNSCSFDAGEEFFDACGSRRTLHNFGRAQKWRDSQRGTYKRSTGSSCRNRKSYWSCSSGIFNFHKFVVASNLRMPFWQLCQRMDVLAIHNPFNVDVPAAVKAFLGKSEKIVARTP